MKQIIILSFTLLFLLGYTNSQVTKGNWLVGGSGRFASQLEHLNGSEVKGLNIQVSTNLGYFPLDKFAGGLKAGYASDKIRYNSTETKISDFRVGPFLRYYFLNPEGRVNILGESSYQYVHDQGLGNANLFSFSAGPVIYFNSSIGLELTLNYELYREAETNTKANTLFFGIGLQVHLEKDRNY